MKMAMLAAAWVFSVNAGFGKEAGWGVTLTTIFDSAGSSGKFPLMIDNVRRVQALENRLGG